MSLVIRTAYAQGSYEKPVKEALKAIDPDRTASDPEPLDSITHDSVSSRRLPMVLFSSFAVLAILLAAAGINGVVNYGVTQRSGEIGVRMALGAQAVQILRMVAGGSMKWAALGILFGVAGAARPRYSTSYETAVWRTSWRSTCARLRFGDLDLGGVDRQWHPRAPRNTGGSGHCAAP